MNDSEAADKNVLIIAAFEALRNCRFLREEPPGTFHFALEGGIGELAVGRAIIESVARPSRLVHRWSGWPGAFCLDCGSEDGIEIALADGNCIEITGEDEQPDFVFPVEVLKTQLCPVKIAWAKMGFDIHDQ